MNEPTFIIERRDILAIHSLEELEIVCYNIGRTAKRTAKKLF